MASITMIATMTTVGVALVASLYSGIDSTNSSLSDVLMANKKSQELENFAKRKELVELHSSNPINSSSSLYVKRNRELLINYDVSEHDKQLIDRLQLAMEKVVIEEGITEPSCSDLSSTKYITDTECGFLKDSNRSYQSVGHSKIIVNDDKVLSILKAHGKISSRSVDSNSSISSSSNEISFTSGDSKIILHKKQEENVNELLEYYEIITSSNEVSESVKSDLSEKITNNISSASKANYTTSAFNSLVKFKEIEENRRDGNEISDTEFLSANENIIEKVNTSYLSQVSTFNESASTNIEEDTALVEVKSIDEMLKDKDSLFHFSF